MRAVERTVGVALAGILTAADVAAVEKSFVKGQGRQGDFRFEVSARC